MEAEPQGGRRSGWQPGETGPFQGRDGEKRTERHKKRERVGEREQEIERQRERWTQPERKRSCLNKANLSGQMG